MTMNNTRADLMAARRLIEENWAQNPLIGKHCAATAISNSVAGEWTEAEKNRGYSNAMGLFAKAIGLDSPGFAGSRIWRWNDAEGRTKDEVLEAFDRAIEAAA
jgi:hypothetical protein